MCSKTTCPFISNSVYFYYTTTKQTSATHEPTGLQSNKEIICLALLEIYVITFYKNPILIIMETTLTLEGKQWATAINEEAIGHATAKRARLCMTKMTMIKERGYVLYDPSLYAFDQCR